MGKVYKFWMGLLAIIGSISMGYFLLLWICLGSISTYNFIWLCLTVLCAGLMMAVYHYGRNGQIPPKWVVIPVEILVGISCLIFIIVETFIIHAGHQKAEAGADYLIILGAKVNGTHPSLILKYRIQAGVEYLKQNPETRVIASGGQGSDEGISEAQCIYEQLITQGIDADRIYLEDQSTSTGENLEYSARYLDRQQDRVVIATTDFHLFRAIRLAKKCGYEQVSGTPAKSVWWLVPTNYTRECLAVLKDLICGNI